MESEEHDSQHCSQSQANDDNCDQSLIRRTYVPNATNLDEDLVFDQSVYVLYHKAETGYPCLSFDIIQDNEGFGDERCERYPLSCCIAAGTQAEKADCNNLLVLKMSNLNKLKHKNNEEDSSDEDSDDEDSKPELESAPISHPGCVNRVRTTRINSTSLAVTWSELGNLLIWDLTRALNAVNDVEAMTSYTRNDECSQQPLFTFTGHRSEGFALDWSAIKPGMLASGDCNQRIFIWKPSESGFWSVDQQSLRGHTDSVEDLQWSPNEENVLASCSVDKSMRIWDVRARPSSNSMLTITDAHDSDINVISWNHIEKAFILSGGDDGVIKTWDLRRFKSSSPKPIATFKHHVSYITSVEWHPTDGTVFAASGNDNQLTLWDLAVEKDSNQDDDMEVNQLPPQLLFIHQGQKEIKEIHWHQQMPGVLISTALTGFDIFRTISV